MATTDFMVAIELGSSRITGVAGVKNGDGHTLRILAFASEDASSAIRKGVILNIDKTALAVSKVVSKLESILDADIAKVYVGIGGQSMRTVRISESRNLGEETRITEDILQELARANRNTFMGELEILEVVPQEYKVGSSLHADPVGVMGNHIEGHFLNVVARSSVRSKIESCFCQAGVKIAGLLVAPICAAQLILTEAERRSGCLLLDFGADTTTVQIWKDHILRHLVVIPLGGNSINRDICSLRIGEESAEEFKQKYATCYTETLVKEEEKGKRKEEKRTMRSDETYTLAGGEKIPARLLDEIVEGRMEEILANVRHQLELSGYADSLLGGVVVTGGGSNMTGLGEALQEKLGTEKFRVASYVSLNVESTVAEVLARDGRSGTLLGLLAAARENCREVKPQTTLFDADSQSSSSNEEEDLESEQELQARLRAAEQEARDKENERLARLAEERRSREEEELRQARMLEAQKKKEEEEARQRMKREKFQNSFLGKMQAKLAKFGDDLLNGE